MVLNEVADCMRWLFVSQRFFLIGLFHFVVARILGDLCHGFQFTQIAFSACLGHFAVSDLL